MIRNTGAPGLAIFETWDSAAQAAGAPLLAAFSQGADASVHPQDLTAAACHNP